MGGNNQAFLLIGCVAKVNCRVFQKTVKLPVVLFAKRNCEPRYMISSASMVVLDVLG
jgi:hypothetical protein